MREEGGGGGQHTGGLRGDVADVVKTRRMVWAVLQRLREVFTSQHIAVYVTGCDETK